ncbi:unnamed protein product, partial [Linum tenue]
MRVNSSGKRFNYMFPLHPCSQGVISRLGVGLLSPLLWKCQAPTGETTLVAREDAGKREVK